jgi:hypothetical protein
MDVLPFRRHKPRREHDRGVGYTAIIFVEATPKIPFPDHRLRVRVRRHIWAVPLPTRTILTPVAVYGSHTAALGVVICVLGSRWSEHQKPVVE